MSFPLLLDLVLWTLVMIQGVALSWLMKLYLAGDLNRSDGADEGGPAVGSTLDLPAGVPQPAVVLLMGATCEPCLSRRELISSLAERLEGQANIVVLCSGKAEEIELFRRPLHRSVVVVPDIGGERTSDLNVFGTPFMIGLDANGIVIDKTRYVQPHTLFSMAMSVTHDAEVHPLGKGVSQ